MKGTPLRIDRARGRTSWAAFCFSGCLLCRWSWKRAAAGKASSWAGGGTGVRVVGALSWTVLIWQGTSLLLLLEERVATGVSTLDSADTTTINLLLFLSAWSKLVDRALESSILLAIRPNASKAIRRAAFHSPPSCRSVQDASP